MFVKICGTTSEEDALLSVALGADAVGFVFAPSPRQMTPRAVQEIVRRLPPEIVTIGVFRDEAPRRVVELVNGIGLKGAQLHGRESPEVSRWVRERVPFTIKAFAAGSAAFHGAEEHGADLVLVDSPSPGSGELFDWRLVEGVVDTAKLVLAGGLDPDNVAASIATVRPYGVDVASGVEAAPGRKDPGRLRAFIAAARQAAPAAYEAEGDGPYDWQEEW